MQTPKTSVNSVDTDQPDAGLFMHAARPPVTGGEKYANQRRFGGYWPVLKEVGFDNDIRISVYRGAQEDFSSLQLSTRLASLGTVDLSIRLTADELQTLAAALIDCAHDLRTRPAHEYRVLQAKEPIEMAA